MGTKSRYGPDQGHEATLVMAIFFAVVIAVVSSFFGVLYGKYSQESKFLKNCSLTGTHVIDDRIFLCKEREG